jgi:hypothetical protein
MKIIKLAVDGFLKWNSSGGEFHQVEENRDFGQQIYSGCRDTLAPLPN